MKTSSAPALISNSERGRGQHMGSVAKSCDRIWTSLIGAAFCGLPWALSAALAIAPRTAAAQDASGSSESKLPEIHVIATSPVAPPPRTAPARVSAGAAPPDTLVGADRAGGGTGVVAMTWISGSFVSVELEASCAAAVPGAIARAAGSAQSDARKTKIQRRCRPARVPI